MAETFLYLVTTGRVSGTPHKIEIWFVEYDGCAYLCSGKGTNADWVQNIQQDAAVQFATGTTPDDHAPLQAGRAVIVTDADEITAVKRLFDAKYDWSNGTLVQVCAAT